MSDRIKFTKSYSGYFLTSSAVLKDPNFVQTLVLLIEHNEKGAFGLTVNRSTGYNVKEILPGNFNEDFDNFPVHLGGPVQKDSLFFLYTLFPQIQENEELQNNLNVCSGVYFGTDYEILKKPNNRFQNIIFFLGYSGWAPLQLEAEFEMKSWIPIQAREKLIFAEQPEKAWKEALKYKGGVYQYFADHVENPDLN